ncbi:FAD-dependent oxidoreductase [Ornithinimicrobium kibberense]|uniref:FAD-dependent oxidoreductase n=1 Tax=Ornithinimicrobium kibberense TaxID=282060 RepID=A0ABV5V0Q2_9MICO|nr:FAD-dependent oxidoreductase [Ornithinimicrobium kibberense]
MTSVPRPSPARIVLIGYGPVGARLVEGLVPSVAAGTVELTVLGAEPEDAYNRVLVGEYAVGRADRARLEITDTAAARAAGVSIRTAEVAVAVDRYRQTVLTGAGEHLPYDRLVLATGSRANVPRLGGLEGVGRSPATPPGAPHDLDRGRRRPPQGVVALRDLPDADVVREAVGAGREIVVLGAGVLGMEIALAACDQGAAVTVVHHGETPMAGTLDRDGGRMLARAARRAGVRMLPHAVAESVSLRHTGSGAWFRGVVCADGTFVPGDLLLLSCGVRPRAELAEAAGLETEFGILVEPDLRCWADPDVFAVGDCAQVAPSGSRGPDGRVGGAPAGLLAPGWRQAETLAARLAAEAAGQHPSRREPATGRPHVVMVKATGVDVVAGGRVNVDPWDEDGEAVTEVAQWLDPARGRYVRSVARAGVLEGFVAVGAPRAGAELTLLLERGAELPADPGTLLRLDASEEAAPRSDPDDPGATVCWCNGVSVGTVCDAAAAGATTVDGVSATTRAGTGCGGCRGRIAELLQRRAPAVETAGPRTSDLVGLGR